MLLHSEMLSSTGVYAYVASLHVVKTPRAHPGFWNEETPSQAREVAPRANLTNSFKPEYYDPNVLRDS